MRAVVVVAMMTVAILVGPSSSAGTFPDLPGSDMLEESITGREIADQQTGHAPAPSADGDNDRVPAPDTSEDAGKVADTAADPSQIAIVADMPGGRGLPIIKDMRGASDPSTPVAPLVLLAALVMLGMTRFLYRLNELGRRSEA